ncbi:hypothetical protein [Candidatus Tisiphia endosymbiont of Beris chalybata]|uniref:hypothetical protein n=1 Tax=Candidatus Tisiphia endosymbiont of Beris chalybata TaxID=3066262 RepID=UPI00312C7CE3
MTFKFEGCIKGGILELTNQKEDIAKEPKFYKDMVEWLENRKDVHTLNLSNLG